MTPADRAAAAAARPRGAQSCSAAGASVSPAGRRRHSGAQRSPLAIVPRTPTAFPSVAGRRGSEPPARPSPPPTASAAGDVGVDSQRSKVGRPGSPGESRGAQAGGSIPPACSAAAGLAVFAGVVPLSRSSPFRPHSLPVGGFRRLLRGGEPPCRLVGSCVICAAGLVNCSLPGAANQTVPVLRRGRRWRGNSGGLPV